MYLFARVVELASMMSYGKSEMNSALDLPEDFSGLDEEDSVVQNKHMLTRKRFALPLVRHDRGVSWKINGLQVMPKRTRTSTTLDEVN